MRSGSEHHSQRHLGPHRDFWWNVDFLELLVRRWELTHVERVLDVGCGKGQWTRLIQQALPGPARAVGVDREWAWVAEADNAARGESGAAQLRFLVGEAARLPFPNSVFDVVTCQTLLIHVSSPERVLAEMLRTLRPGGLLVLVEPSNRATHFAATNCRAARSRERLMEEADFLLTCEAGKLTLGDGDNSLGDILPGLLAAQGVDDLQVYLADRSFCLVPPYADEFQQRWRDQLIAWAESGTWIWAEPKARRYFEAGGGDPAEFGARWANRMREQAEDAAMLRAGLLHTAGGRVMYVISARRRRRDDG